jgi:hypothetical protein
MEKNNIQTATDLIEIFEQLPRGKVFRTTMGGSLKNKRTEQLQGYAEVSLVALRAVVPAGTELDYDLLTRETNQMERLREAIKKGKNAARFKQTQAGVKQVTKVRKLDDEGTAI